MCVCVWAGLSVSICMCLRVWMPILCVSVYQSVCVHVPAYMCVCVCVCVWVCVCVYQGSVFAVAFLIECHVFRSGFLAANLYGWLGGLEHICRGQEVSWESS